MWCLAVGYLAAVGYSGVWSITFKMRSLIKVDLDQDSEIRLNFEIFNEKLLYSKNNRDDLIKHACCSEGKTSICRRLLQVADTIYVSIACLRRGNS